MRITAIREVAVPLQGYMANAVVDFSHHTVSMVALISDQFRHGKPVIGLGFNSIGRFAQSGIMRDRMIPRLLASKPAQLLDPNTHTFAPSAVVQVAMQNEKPGGHGDRCSAVAAIELATWDLNAKLMEQPAYAHIADVLGRTPTPGGIPVYAAGGYYYAEDSNARLHDEISRYREDGYHAFKIKVGGQSLAEDLSRVETAIEAAHGASRVAVDANGCFSITRAQQYSQALSSYQLKWFEEPCDPLDYRSLSQLAKDYTGSIATGENLFSAIDTQNLIRYGGLRAAHDVLQMDPGLSYGLTEYLKMIEIAEAAGFTRRQCIPHGGHLINLHIATALNLGGCEAYPGVFQPFGGYTPACILSEGRIVPSDAPGFGLEQKSELAPIIRQLGDN